MPIRNLARMRLGLVLLLVPLALAAALPVAAQQQPDDFDRCVNGPSGDNHDTLIAACTAVLDSGETSSFKRVGAYTSRAFAFLARREHDRAIADFSEAIKLIPGSPHVRFGRGKAYQGKGDNDQAIADYTDTIRLNYPDLHEPYLKRADAYYAKREYDLAIADYTEAIRLNPADKQAVLSRGRAYQAKGDNDRAIADYTEVITLNPDFAQGYDVRGYAYHAKGDYDRAIEDFSEAIRLEPSLAQAYYHRGYTYQAKGQLDRAMDDYDEAIRLNPDFVPVYTDRGQAFLDMADYERAIADFTESIRLDPKFTPAYAGRARARVYAGALADADTDLKEAIGLDPTDIYVALWIELAERRAGLPSRLKELSGRLDMAKWPAPVARLLMGELTGEQALAAADSADPKTRSEQACEVHFYSGELALIESHQDDAERLFREAAAECPRSYIERSAAWAELRLLLGGK